MNNKSSTPYKPSELFCGICGTDKSPLSRYQGGYVCEPCVDISRQGRTETTKALRAQQRANRAARSLLAPEEGLSATPAQLEYIKSAGQLLAADALSTPVQCVPLAGGELAEPSAESATTLTSSVVALEASNERVHLVSALGYDIAALALDTAESAGAVGSIEQMLAHQVAAAHHQMMTMLTKASVEPIPTLQMQYSALAAKWMAASNNAALTLKKYRTNGEQRITIQHVNVSQGGQAVIGDVRAGGQ